MLLKIVVKTLTISCSSQSNVRYAALNQTGIIRAVVLPDNDLLLGFYIPCCDTADEEDEYRHIDYYKLSEIRMEYRPVDMEEFYGGQEPD